MTRSIVFDIDGCLFDFKKFDNQFISKNFKRNRLILVLDKLLWKVNGLDFIKNTEHLLKIRFMIYCFISIKSYKYIINKYKLEYQESLKNDLICNAKKVIVWLKRLNYNSILITNNSASKKIAEDVLDCFCYIPNNFAKNKKQLYLVLKDNYDIQYIVGNNYMDDLKVAKKLGIKSIYMGNSVLKNFFKIDYTIISINEVIKIVTQ